MEIYNFAIIFPTLLTFRNIHSTSSGKTKIYQQNKQEKLFSEKKFLFRNHFIKEKNTTLSVLVIYTQDIVRVAILQRISFTVFYVRLLVSH